MAWTSPRTWVAGETVTAALLNTHVRDNEKAIGDPWTSYTPTFTNAGTAPTGVVAKYISAGKLTIVRVAFTLASAPAGIVQVSLPVTASTAYGTGAQARIGGIGAVDTSAATYYQGIAYLASSTTASFISHASATPWTAATPLAWASGDIWVFDAVYEAA